jgi:N utilization substance protein B
MANRHLSRTIAMQTLFAWDFNDKKDDLDDLIKENFKQFAPNFDDQGFVENLVFSTVKNLDKIDNYIVKYATEWPLDQITAVDRNILRLGVCELIFDEKMPAKVAINEAIEIAKSFGGDTSGKFVNGVLGAILKELPEKEIDKNNKENETEKEISAGGVVYFFDGNGYKFVLILDIYNKWTFPKGKQEEGEDLKITAEREIKEETGLKDVIVKDELGKIHIEVKRGGKRIPKTIHFFLIEAKDIELINPEVDEIKDLKWVEENDVLNILDYETVKDIFKKALEKIKG